MTAVTPAPDSRLAQLCSQYDLAKAEADKAAETLKAITDGIKHELVALLPPGADRVDLDTPLLARPMRFQSVQTWRVDTKRLKAEDPLAYVKYAVQGTSWKLAPLGATP